MSRVQTECRNCIFSIRQDGKQIGCEFNRLDKFPKEWNEEHQAYIIQRLCTRCRNSEWLSRHQKEDVLKETKVKVDAIVLHKCSNDIIETLRGFNVNSIVVATNHIELDAVEILREKMVRVVKTYYKATDEELVDEAVQGCKGRFYAIINSPVKYNFVSELQQLVEEDLTQVIYIDKEIPIYNRHVHNYLGGNRKKLLREKIKEHYESDLFNS